MSDTTAEEGKTHHRGVFWDGKNHRWRAQVGFKNKKIFLGYYHDIDLAAAAYDRKVVELHGATAKTNFPIEAYLPEVTLAPAAPPRRPSRAHGGRGVTGGTAARSRTRRRAGVARHGSTGLKPNSPLAQQQEQQQQLAEVGSSEMPTFPAFAAVAFPAAAADAAGGNAAPEWDAIAASSPTAATAAGSGAATAFGGQFYSPPGIAGAATTAAPPGNAFGGGSGGGVGDSGYLLGLGMDPQLQAAWAGNFVEGQPLAWGQLGLEQPLLLTPLAGVGGMWPQQQQQFVLPQQQQAQQDSQQQVERQPEQPQSQQEHVTPQVTPAAASDAEEARAAEAEAHRLLQCLLLPGGGGGAAGTAGGGAFDQLPEALTDLVKQALRRAAAVNTLGSSPHSAGAGGPPAPASLPAPPLAQQQQAFEPQPPLPLCLPGGVPISATGPTRQSATGGPAAAAPPASPPAAAGAAAALTGLTGGLTSITPAFGADSLSRWSSAASCDLTAAEQFLPHR